MATKSNKAMAFKSDGKDFVPYLVLIERLLLHAEELAKYSDIGVVGDPTFGSMGAELLEKVFTNWKKVQLLRYLKPLRIREKSDVRQLAVIQFLDDMSSGLFPRAKWELAGDVPLDPIEKELNVKLKKDSQLGMSHSDFVKQLKYVIGVLSRIVPRKGMSVADADRKARELTDSHKKKKDFFTLSQSKQAKTIGCHWATYAKTPFFREAEKKGLFRKRQRPLPPSKIRGNSQISRLTPALESTIGQDNLVLKQLLQDEDENKQWADLSVPEKLAIINDQEADLASDSKQKGTGSRRYGRNRN
jgi:hypothetical protein